MKLRAEIGKAETIDVSERVYRRPWPLVKLLLVLFGFSPNITEPLLTLGSPWTRSTWYSKPICYLLPW